YTEDLNAVGGVAESQSDIGNIGRARRVPDHPGHAIVRRPVREVRIVLAHFDIGRNRAAAVVDGNAGAAGGIVDVQRSGAGTIVTQRKVDRVAAVGAVDVRLLREQSVDAEDVGLRSGVQRQ